MELNKKKSLYWPEKKTWFGSYLCLDKAVGPWASHLPSLGLMYKIRK